MSVSQRGFSVPMPFEKKEVSGRGTIFSLLYVESVAFVCSIVLLNFYMRTYVLKRGCRGEGVFFHLD